MKITPEHYSALKNACFAVLQRKPEAQAAYKASGLSDKRFRWDVLWASRFNTTLFYGYLNDAHIDTALCSIVAEYGATCSSLCDPAERCMVTESGRCQVAATSGDSP